MWLIELSGDQPDLDELKKLAPHLECEIALAHDGREYLSGRNFEGLSSAEEVSAAAIEVLTLLNGLARVGWSQFRSVRVAGVSQMRPDGTKAAFVHTHIRIRPRVSGKCSRHSCRRYSRTGDRSRSWKCAREANYCGPEALRNRQGNCW